MSAKVGTPTTWQEPTLLVAWTPATARKLAAAGVSAKAWTPTKWQRANKTCSMDASNSPDATKFGDASNRREVSTQQPIHKDGINNRDSSHSRDYMDETTAVRLTSAAAPPEAQETS
jgi:hypothetical protein